MSSKPLPSRGCPVPRRGTAAPWAATSTTQGTSKAWLLTETDGVWAPGVEAPLPDDAGTTGRWVDLNSVSCPSVGNCTAVGDYSDTANDLQALLLDETAGVWAAGPKSELPANAA